MQWLALIVWVLVVALALPLGAGSLQGRASLALQALAAVGGFALLLVYVLAGEHSTPAWIACGLAVLGVLAMVFAVAGLTSDRPAPVSAASPRSQTIEEYAAALAGAQLPLFAVAGLVTLPVALGIGT